MSTHEASRNTGADIKYSDTVPSRTEFLSVPASHDINCPMVEVSHELSVASDAASESFVRRPRRKYAAAAEDLPETYSLLTTFHIRPLAFKLPFC